MSVVEQDDCPVGSWFNYRVTALAHSDTPLITTETRFYYSSFTRILPEKPSRPISNNNATMRWSNQTILPSVDLRRERCQADEIESKTPQRFLLLAIEGGDLLDVHQAIFRIPASKLMSVLLAQSKRPEHQLRTPLMAAVASGDLAIFGAVIEALNRLFRGENEIDKSTRVRLKQERALAMQVQLQLVDMGGANLLMIAASTASVAIFNAVTREIRPSQARKILLKQDVRGMTYLMYAINPKAMCVRPVLDASNLLSVEDGVSDNWRGQRLLPPCTKSRSTEADASPRRDSGASDSVTGHHAGLAIHAANPWVPVVKRVLEFARQCLWMPEYLELLQMKDSWDRSIFEHAIISGRHSVFNAVFDIIRQDVYDEEIEQMLEVGEESEYEPTAMRVALNSKGGKKVADLVSGKIAHLKRDVAFRAESSTVSSKIQTFIPGNLIVIFQLLLPEMDVESHTPLIILLLLCLIAPFWAWGASLVTKAQPERQNTLARVTWARHMLAGPSMFFWGLGTSAIGQYSFNWSESMTAATLAVATVIIPAIDSFAAGTGARAFYGTIFVEFLSLYDEVKDKHIPSWFKAKEASMIFDDDDEWQPRSWIDHARGTSKGYGDVATSTYYRKRAPFHCPGLNTEEKQNLEDAPSDNREPNATVTIGVRTSTQSSISTRTTRLLRPPPCTSNSENKENTQDAASNP